MSDLPEQLELPQGPASKETLYVQRMKERVLAMRQMKGDKICVTFKMDRQRHAVLLDKCRKHGMTMTDIFTLHVDGIIPVLDRAEPVEVPGYKVDERTKSYSREGHRRVPPARKLRA